MRTHIYAAVITIGLCFLPGSQLLQGGQVTCRDLVADGDDGGKVRGLIIYDHGTVRPDKINKPKNQKTKLTTR